MSKKTLLLDKNTDFTCGPKVLPYYLSNLLKKRTGSSFQTLVTNQRMLTARQLLLNSSLAITEVASRVGYENTTFFYKKFEQLYGCSPSEFRRK